MRSATRRERYRRIRSISSKAQAASVGDDLATPLVSKKS
ncbi:hypothetical protein IVB48_15550 [Bradyrhizobium sp. 76]|nr:hypothetical protein [Bradyrhizobium sp. 76]